MDHPYLLHQINGIENRNIIDSIIKNLSILIFNAGNKPHYNIRNLDDDLKMFDPDMPVIFLSSWYSNMMVVNNSLLDLEKYPNLFHINWRQRINYNSWSIENVSGPSGHPCMPGIPEHATLSITHLINLLVSINKNHF